MRGFHGILPNGVVVAEDWIVNLPLQLHPDECRFAGGSAARTREFAAGRACARRALGSLGAANRPVAVGSSREPIWPEGFVGSISHTRDYCAAAVAHDHGFAAIGIDVEMCMPVHGAMLRLVCTESERRWCAGHDSIAGCLLFSAKESAFKALHPLLRFNPGFQALQFQANLDHGTLSATADAGQNPRLASLLKASRGAFCLDNGHIFTALWISRDGEFHHRTAA